MDLDDVGIVIALGLDVGIVKGQPQPEAAAFAKVATIEFPRRPRGGNQRASLSALVKAANTSTSGAAISRSA